MNKTLSEYTCDFCSSPSILKNNTTKSFTFIDLFSGIGGFHIALHSLGGRCIYACERDEHARKTYKENFYSLCPDLFDNNMFCGDITLGENKERIPENVDILCGGFPCQPFSQLGYKKGFKETRGTLFFDIANIIKNKKPKSFFLENVRYLFSHNNGNTFKIIKQVIEKDLGYVFYFQIMKASDFGLPTHRSRIFMIGFRNDFKNVIDFRFPKPISLQFTMSQVFKGICNKDIGYTLRVGGRGSGIGDKRNWDAYIVDGKERRLTSEEAKMMMGFPKNFYFPVTETQALKQLGNSVAIFPVVMVAENMLKAMGIPIYREHNTTITRMSV